MIILSSYDGKITSIIHGCDEYVGTYEGGLLYAGQEVPDWRRHYILDGELTERPTSPVTLSNLTLLSVPAGSTLWINTESYAAEGDIELEFPLPGAYQLRLECWPYRDWEGEVTV